MSSRKSRVRPVPDFSRAHQLLESQLEARKKEMKFTKVEEFNLSKGFARSGSSTTTPNMSEPRHLDFARLQTNPIRSPALSSSGVNGPKARDGTTSNFEPNPGLLRKTTGILKNAGRTGEATAGQKEARRTGALLGRRPRVTFDVASPVGESPIRVARRVRVAGYSNTPRMTSPKPVAASRILVACNRVPVEPDRNAQSTRNERHQPRRVLVFGSDRRMMSSQSCSRAACMVGFPRFRADSVAKAIDFNEESEEDGKTAVSEDLSKNHPEMSTAAVATTSGKFSGLRSSPMRKIHVDVMENTRNGSVGSPLLRLNSNSDASVRSPLLRKIESMDARNKSRLPQPKNPKGKAAGKENRAKSFAEKKRKLRGEKIELIVNGGGKIESIPRSSEDQDMKMEEMSLSVQMEALLEEADSFDANQTINRLERKAQRLRRRSHLTEDQSELDDIMTKLEHLQQKIDSIRLGFDSVHLACTSDAAGNGVRSLSTSNDPEQTGTISNVDSAVALNASESQEKEELSEVEEEPGEDARTSNVLEVALESMEGNVTEVSFVDRAVKSKSTDVLESHNPLSVSEIDVKSKDNAVYDMTTMSEVEFRQGATSYVEPLEIESHYKAQVPQFSSDIELRSENCFGHDTPSCSPSPADNSDGKENVDPLAEVAVDVSLNNSVQTGVDNPMRCTDPCERVVLQDITGEIQSRAVEVDDGVFVVEESSDDSELMNSEDFTEWSSSPLDLMNRCLMIADCELSSDPSVVVTPEDVLAQHLAKLSISERLDTSNVEPSPNMSSEFMQYNRYGHREGVDGMARLFNPVAAALDDGDSDDAHFVPISPSP